MTTKILILAANPKDTARLRLDEEVREIENGLQRAQKRESFEIKVQWATRIQDVRRAMLDFCPNIVHFSGHGKGEAGIKFEDDLGESHVVSAEALAGFFKLFAEDVQCVVLNACYSEIQANAIAQHIPYVIGMSDEIGDRTAIEFAVAFYDALGAGRSVEFAYELACNAIQMAGIPSSEGQGVGIPEHLIPVLIHKRVDWGEAPDVSVFFGRSKELETLEQWILKDRCRLVAVLGIAGIGKTNLTAKLVEGIQEKFDFVIWKNLLNAPPVEEILADIIKFLSNQQEIDLPNNVDVQISRLLDYLNEHRCLLILDNMEAILVGGDHPEGDYQKTPDLKNLSIFAKIKSFIYKWLEYQFSLIFRKFGLFRQFQQYREGYKGYDELLRQVGEVAHQSCVLLTSREKPKEIARLEGQKRPVRSLELSGLDEIDGRKLFETIGEFSGSDEDWKTLIEFYNGNPLALELAAKHIQEVFFGDIAAFLQEGKPVFSDLRELLDWHFEQLSDLEKEVMYWLAIEREPVSLQELKEKIVSPESRNQLPSTLQALQRRVPLEWSAIRFTLQPVLIEYMTERLIEQVGNEMKIRTAELAEYTTERFVEQVGQEIATGKIALFNSHALIEALAKDYIRESQSQLILKPLIEKLLAHFGTQEQLESHLKQILSTLRDQSPRQPGYVAGNILNILIHLGSELNNFDFSYLVVWQAYLRDIDIHDVNFAHADLKKSTLTETFSTIHSVAYSPNGELVAIGGSYGEIRVWQVVDEKPFLTLVSNGGWVTSMAFSPDSRLLASGALDQSVSLWDIEKGQCIKTFEGHTRAITSVAFSPDGGTLASSSEDHTVKLWDISTGKYYETLQEHTNVVWSVAFNTDGTMLASGSQDETVKLWDVKTGQYRKTLQGDGMVWSVTFNERDLLASSTRNVKLWNVTTGQCQNTLQGHTSEIRAIAFSPDGNILASASGDRTVKLWNVTTGQCQNTLQGHTSGIQSIAFSPDGMILVSGSRDHMFKLWNVSTGLCLKTHQGYHGGIQSVAFSPCGDILASGSGDHTVRLWDVNKGQCLSTLQGHTSVVRTVAFHPDGDMLASSSDDQTVKLWDLNTKQCSRAFSAVSLGYAATPVAFSPNGDILVISTELQYIHSQQSKKVSQGSQRHTRKVVSVAFSPDGTILATGSLDETLKLWDIQTGQYLRGFTAHTRGVYSIAFHPNGNILASCDGNYKVKLWEVATGRRLKTLEIGGVKTLVFAPDGSFLATGSENTVKFWDLDTYQCLNTLQGHTEWISSIAFSPDSRILASGSYDGTIKVWDVQSGKCLNTLKSGRPYERMNITGVTGLTEAQKANLKALGAVED